MMFMLAKVTASALVIGGVNLVARANPQLGGWIAALPLVSILSIIWLAADGASGRELNLFVSRVLLGLFPTIALLGIIALCLARGLSLPVALGCAAVAWGLLTVGASQLGLLA